MSISYTIITILVYVYIKIGLRTIGADILEGYHAAKKPDPDAESFLVFFFCGVLLWPAVMFFGVALDSQDLSPD